MPLSLYTILVSIPFERKFAMYPSPVLNQFASKTFLYHRVKCLTAFMFTCVTFRYATLCVAFVSKVFLSRDNNISVAPEGLLYAISFCLCATEFSDKVIIRV